MPEKEQDEQTQVIREKIKQRPMNKRKLLQSTVITTAMGIIFGLVAGLTFISIKPVTTTWFGGKETVEQGIVFPEDPQEMLPEEMTTSYASEDGEWVYHKEDWENIPLTQEQIRRIVTAITLDRDDYKSMYDSLAQYARGLRHSMVTIVGSYSNTDWLENTQESQNQIPGVFIASNEQEYYILTEYSPIQDAQKLKVSLAYYEDYEMPAYMKAHDVITDIAILRVNLEDVPEIVRQRNGISIAALGSSNVRNLEGTPVIALGSPMGMTGSIGYGMITSTAGQYSAQDSNYRLLQTDISGSSKAKGFLFNLKGEMIGMITDKSTYDMKNLITSYGITDLKPRMEKLSNGRKIPFVGITIGNVPKSAHEEQGVPYGVYVQSVANDSPAMVAGMQQGDIIIEMGGRSLLGCTEYTNLLLQEYPGNTVEMMVMRQVQNQYRELSVEVNLGQIQE